MATWNHDWGGDGLVEEIEEEGEEKIGGRRSVTGG